MKTTGNKDFDKALARLRSRLVKLTKTTDAEPIARRNARRGALSALALLRAAMDRQFPAIIIKRKFTKLKTFEGRAMRLVRAGWKQVDREDTPGYAAAGITVKRLEHTEKGHGTTIGWFIPQWAWAIAGHGAHLRQKELRAAKKSTIEKRAALAAHVMASTT